MQRVRALEDEEEEEDIGSDEVVETTFQQVLQNFDNERSEPEGYNADRVQPTQKFKDELADIIATDSLMSYLTTDLTQVMSTNVEYLESAMDKDRALEKQIGEAEGNVGDVDTQIEQATSELEKLKKKKKSWMWMS